MILSRYSFLSSCLPLVLLASVAWTTTTTNAWMIPSSSSIKISSRRGRAFFSSHQGDDGDFVDVDFERVSEATSSDATTNSNNPPPAPKNLFDASLAADPDLDWNNVRIPFCRDQEYIDGKLSFTIDMEGVTYGIAIPYDDAVAIVEESPKVGNILYVRPDEEDETGEGRELMEIMAKQVQEHLGDGELELRKTPKVLTISGGLSKYTENWEKDLVPESLTVKELLEDDDPEISEFYEFMRSELGDEEFEKTIKEEVPKGVDPEIMKLFDVPGLGDQAGDMQGLEAMLKEIVEEEKQGEVQEAQAFQPNMEGMALRLIGFNFGDGSKSYSLVKLLQPYTLVGKYIDDGNKEEIKFELLTPEEEKLIIPKLEDLCRQDLESAGLSLANAEPSKVVTPE
jgi:hypothetical protein